MFPKNKKSNKNSIQGFLFPERWFDVAFNSRITTRKQVMNELSGFGFSCVILLNTKKDHDEISPLCWHAASALPPGF